MSPTTEHSASSPDITVLEQFLSDVEGWAGAKFPDRRSDISDALADEKTAMLDNDGSSTPELLQCLAASKTANAMLHEMARRRDDTQKLLPNMMDMKDDRFDDLPLDDEHALWNRPDWFSNLDAHKELKQATDACHRAFTSLLPHFSAQICRDYIEMCISSLHRHRGAIRLQVDELSRRSIQRDTFLRLLSEARQRRLARTISESFVGNSLDEPETCWLGGWPLGRGGCGLATLWVKQDHEGLVADRCVVKDSHLTRFPSLWADHSLWTNDLPNEVYAMKILTDAKNSRSAIIQLRNYRLRTEERMWRIYMEYAVHGDMDEFMRRYRYRVEYQKVAGAPISPQDLVPETFVWRTFKSLIQGAHLMAFGSSVTESDRSARPPNPSSWDAIVHRDLKLPNLVLSSPDEHEFPGYPTVKIADFGLAAIFPGGLPPSADFDQVGTPGYYSPEQSQHIYAGETQVRLLSEKTNVWGIGMCLWSLMECENGCWDLDYENESTREPRWQPQILNTYSPILVQLVQWCLQYEVDRRPTVSELWREVSRVLDERETSQRSDGIESARRLQSLARGDRVWRSHALLDLDVAWESVALGKNLASFGPPPAWQGQFPPPAHPKEFFLQSGSQEELLDDGHDIDHGIPPRQGLRTTGPAFGSVLSIASIRPDPPSDLGIVARSSAGAALASGGDDQQAVYSTDTTSHTSSIEPPPSATHSEPAYDVFSKEELDRPSYEST